MIPSREVLFREREWELGNVTFSEISCMFALWRKCACILLGLWYLWLISAKLFWRTRSKIRLGRPYTYSVKENIINEVFCIFSRPEGECSYGAYKWQKLIDTDVGEINSSFYTVLQHRHKSGLAVPRCRRRHCVASLCWKERRWGEEKLRERFHTAVYIEKNNLTGSVFYRFHSPNYTDFPLQSSPFFFPFPLVSAFISFLNFCFLFTPHCHFDVCASFGWIFFVCSNKILYPRCHLSGRFHCRHRV